MRYLILVLLLGVGLVVACGDAEEPTGPTDPITEESEPGDTVELVPVEGAVGAAIWCQATLQPAAINCFQRDDAPVGEGELVPGSTAVLGGQGENVQLMGFSANYVASSGIFRASLRVDNLLDYILGSPDGFQLNGIQVFFHSQPIAVAGEGAVRVRNADGTDTFTAADQDYFRYRNILDPGTVSPSRTWEWVVEPDVEEFGFAAYVQAEIAEPVYPPETGFEERGASGWTTDEEEWSFLEQVAAGSPRMTYTTMGESVQGRPLHLVRVGYPEPPPDEMITAGRSILLIGGQHGNEPAGREMALELLRDLAFTRDLAVLEHLAGTSMLVIPTANPDGRQANNRSNAMGLDTNRDHTCLVTPEAKVMAQAMRDFHPDIVVDAHERPTATLEDMQVLWPRNLNVFGPVRELSREMVEEYVMPDVAGAGYSVGLYAPNPGAPGDENEMILRNAIGLRHSLGMLTESAGGQPAADRVAVQYATMQGVMRFHRERTAAIADAVSTAPEHKATAGAAGSEPFYLFGADNDPPSPDVVLDPPPCGYLINTWQAEEIRVQRELFPLEAQQVSDTGIFISMGQPLMTVVPLLLDPRARAAVVEGIALVDAAACADPGSLDPPPPPPPPTEPGQHDTDFSGQQVGSPPSGWSGAWREAQWTVYDNPWRVRHEAGATTGRSVLTWDEVGDDGFVQGDVEIFGVVRVLDPMATTRFQFMLHVSGDAGSENAYYVDARDDGSIRINSYTAGSFSNINSGSLPFTMEAATWYRVVLRRSGDLLQAKMWPDGDDEPEGWLVTASSTAFGGGRVGFGHFGADVVNEWAYVSVGTGGEPAPRAPAGVSGSGG